MWIQWLLFVLVLLTSIDHLTRGFRYVRYLISREYVTSLYAHAPRSSSRRPSRSSPSKRPPSKQSPKSRPRSAPSLPSSQSTSIDQPLKHSEPILPPVKNYATQNILGENVMICRDFKIDNLRQFQFVGSYPRINHLPVFPLPEIAFVGRSNVGKSSLINAISGGHQTIAIESKVPGRTQAINLFECKDKDGNICILTDLPGYGYAKLSKEKQQEISEAVREYFLKRDALRLVILIVDVRRETQESDMQMMQFFEEEGIPYCIVATKIDKVSRNELEASIRRLRSDFQLPAALPVAFSSVTGQGVRDVWRMIRDAMLAQGLYAEIDSRESDEYEDEEDYEDEEEEGVW